MADVYEQNLPQKTDLTTSDYVRVVGSDNNSYKQPLSDVAQKTVENYAGSTLAGSAQSVKSAIDGLNTSINGVASDLASESSTRASQDTNLQTQINQLVAPTGTAPNPAEIENARIGADNVTYTTLGDAIRTQVTDLKSAIHQSFNFDNKLYGVSREENKAVNPADGNLFNASGWTATDYIPVTANSEMYSNSIYLIAFYDSSKAFVSGWDALPLKFTVPSGASYIRVSVSTTAVNPYISNSYNRDFAPPLHGFLKQSDIENDDNYVKGCATPNLLRDSDYIDNSYIDYNTGVVSDNSNYRATNHLLITGTKLYASNCDQGAFYNAQQQYISGFTRISDGGIDVPSNAVSFKISVYKPLWDMAYVGFSAPSQSFYYPKHPYVKADEIEPKKVVYVGNGGDYTSILSALRHTPDSTKIFVGYGTYNIVQEYINEYSGYFWQNYGGYSGVEDNFYKGLWIDNGRVIEFSPLAKVVWDYDGSNSAVNTYFAPFSLGENGTIIGLNIEFNQNCRYAIHDDFATTEGTNLIKDCIFNAVGRTGGTTIGGGCNGYNTYKVENCIFNGDSENDISYHNSYSIGRNRIYVTNCKGDNKCHFGKYGQSTSADPTYAIVSGCEFESIVCVDHTQGANDNIILVECNNTVQA